MARALHRPKADHPGILERHLKAERIGIEGAAGGEVADHEFVCDTRTMLKGGYRFGSGTGMKLS